MNISMVFPAIQDYPPHSANCESDEEGSFLVIFIFFNSFVFNVLVSWLNRILLLLAVATT